MSKTTVFLTTAGVIANNHLLPVALGATLAVIDKKNIDGVSTVVAWGKKPSSQRASKFAKKHHLPLWWVEDGFLRSLDSGTNSKYGLSFVVDDLGIYFDLTRPNRLQALIFETMANWHEDKQCLAQQAISHLLQNQLSKYNNTTNVPNLKNMSKQDEAVLVIDQVAGDASIAGAGVDEVAFYQMLEQAIKTYPTQTIVVKAHPAGRGILTHQGQLSQAVQTYLNTQYPNELDRILVICDNVNPIGLLRQAQAVFTVSSHMGFEALLLGKKVHCFGVSWYAGFGLTDDTALKSHWLYQQVLAYHQTLGQGLVSIEQLFYASYVAYSRYVNPATKQVCDIMQAMQYLNLNRHHKEQFATSVLAYGLSKWKVGFVQDFLAFVPNLQVKARPMRLPMVTDLLYAKLRERQDQQCLPYAVQTQADYVVWGQKAKQDLLTRLHRFNPTVTPTIWCMEDGFIRSNGLGATLLEPLSVVVDEVGIYYDATQPSRLEQILSQINITQQEHQQADQLRALLLTKRVSKYNVGTKNAQFLTQLAQLQQRHPHKKVRLVVGQVEDDASVQLCTSQIKRNALLLERVCDEFADDIIVYKPHPDVEAGLRTGKIDEQTLSRADLVAVDTPMPDCLQACQVVHTISSLTGFEALIRGKEVVCYGLPFYAGFGLTQDVIEADNLPKQNALLRRKRATPLSLEALIMGVLIQYPLYRLPEGYGLTTPQMVIDYLYEQSKNAPHAQPSKIKKLSAKAKRHAMQIRHRFIRQ